MLKTTFIHHPDFVLAQVPDEQGDEFYMEMMCSTDISMYNMSDLQRDQLKGKQALNSIFHNAAKKLVSSSSVISYLCQEITKMYD